MTKWFNSRVLPTGSHPLSTTPMRVSMTKTKIPAEVRFNSMTYYCPITGCWLWMGALHHTGRPVFSYNSKFIFAYRWAWEQENGPVPDGLVLDHFACDNPGCVNPDHLRPVSPRENTLRGRSLASANAAKNECPVCGNEYIWATGSKIQRYCRPCKTRVARKLKNSKREKA